MNAPRAMILLPLLACSVLTSLLWAQETPVYPVVKPEGTMFLVFRADMTDNGLGKGWTEWNTYRSYFGALAEFSPRSRARVTFDLVSLKPVTIDSTSYSPYRGYTIRLKYCYVDIGEFHPDLMVTLGMQVLPYVNPYEGRFRQGYLVPPTLDLYGFLVTSDIGLAIRYDVPGKWGSAALYSFNGNGYNTLETNRFKDYAGAFTFTPAVDDPWLKGILVSGMYYLGTGTGPITSWSGKRDIIEGLFSYRYDPVVLGVEYTTGIYKSDAADEGHNASLLSLFGVLYAPFLEPQDKLWLFGRCDLFDPSDQVTEDGLTSLWTGLGYSPVKGIRLALTYQGQFPEASNLTAKSTLMINGEVKF